MPWQNQSGGPWGGGGGQGPWGGRGGGGSPPPDLEEMLRRSQDKLKSIIPGGGSPGKFIPLIVAIVAGLWMVTGFYRVQPDEQGVELVFGKWSGLTTEQGLHWNWPAPIGAVFTPKVTRSNRVEIGYRGGADGARRAGAIRDVNEESVMLTSDENIVELHFTVLWKIKNAGEFLFNIRDPEATVKVAAESVMREVVGQTNFDQTVTVGREEIERKADTLLQSVLDTYKAGILVETIQLQKSDPPTDVIDAFNDVQRARQDKDRLQNEAQAYANSIVPEARGQAEQMTRGAEAYRERLLKESEGEAKRFQSVYEAYRTAPEVTRRRMYLEALGEVFGSAQKVIIDQKGGAGGGAVVPYLPLPELQKRPRARSAEPAEGSTATGSQGSNQSSGEVRR
jgi:membrane protease subunit HflK